MHRGRARRLRPRSALFTWQTDPVQVPWRTLMAELARDLGDDAAYLPFRVQASGMSALVLGLDQMLHADTSLVRRLLRVAQEHGVSHVDTGMAGEGGQALFRKGSEPAVVQRFSTITRVTSGGHRPARCGRRRRRRRLARAQARARRSATWGDGGATSCSSSVDGGIRDDGAAWQRLCEYRDAGEVNRIGVRVRTREELDEALRLPALGHLELTATRAPWWARLAARSARRLRCRRLPPHSDPDGRGVAAARRTSPPWARRSR